MVLTQQIVSREFDTEACTAFQLKCHAAAIVVGRGAGLIGEGNAGSGVHSAHGATNPFQNGIVGSRRSAVRPRRASAKLIGAINEGRLTEGICPSGQQFPCARVEPVVELGALSDGRVNVEGLACGDINAATVNGGAVVVEGDTTLGGHIAIDAQGSACVARDSGCAAQRLITPDLNVRGARAGGVAQCCLTVYLQDTIPDVEADLSVVALEHHGAKTTLHDEVRTVICCARTLCEREPSLHIEPTVGASERQTPIEGEGILPKGKSTAREDDL